MLESRSQTARVRFETEVGDGEVDVVAGRVVDGYVNDVVGRNALFALLGATEGHFEISYEALAPRPELATSIAQLLAQRTRRAAEWRSLCERAPALGSVPTLTAAGRAMLDDPKLPAKERMVLPLIDGLSTVTEVISESKLDAVVALGIIAGAVQRGWLGEAAAFVQTAAGAEGGAVPVGPAVAEKAVPIASVFNIASTRAPSLSGLSLRKRTSIGIGIVDPGPQKPPETTGVVPAGTSAQLAPVPVMPVRRRSSELPPAPTPAPPPMAEDSQPSHELISPTSAAPVAGEAPSRGKKYIGRYELLCRIGYGGMGSVYLCRLTSEGGFKRLFALKVLRSHLSQDGDAATKFLQEARLAGHVHHPNVVSVVDAGLRGTQPYLVMDYVEGASLKQLMMADASARPAEMIVTIVLDALAGLHAAHTLVGEDGRPLQLVHCDVSPENLLIGVDGVCRLSDFGVARYGPRVKDRSEIAQGKPGYLAPEQITRGRVDERADIFAMGVVLYNALTGTKLFDAPTTEETLKLVCTAPVPPPSTVGLRPPPSLDFVCMKALERDPNRRFTTAEEMMDLIRRIALREELLASHAQVAAWVKRLVGPELSQRRLVVLDLSRRGGGGGESMAPPPVTSRSDVLPSPPAPAVDGVPAPARLISSLPPPSNENLSQTIVLNLAPKRPWALIIAAALAALAVLVTLLWPGAVSKLFRLNTEGSVEHEVNVTEPSPAPASSP
jgi:serine/threonine-protein kinase